MPLLLTVSCFSEIHIGWYWLTWVVLEKGPLNECNIDQYAGSYSWSQDLLLCRTHCFSTNGGRNHHQYSLCPPGFHLPRHAWSLMNHLHTGQGPCRANLHKRGLARSSSRDRGQRQTTNHHTVDTCALTVWRWTESTPRSGWWCSHKAGIYCDCSTRKIIIIILHPATSTERWTIIPGLLLDDQHARHQWV